jgi:hypothetical protein
MHFFCDTALPSFPTVLPSSSHVPLLVCLLYDSCSMPLFPVLYPVLTRRPNLHSLYTDALPRSVSPRMSTIPISTSPLTLTPPPPLSLYVPTQFRPLSLSSVVCPPLHMCMYSAFQYFTLARSQSSALSHTSLNALFKSLLMSYSCLSIMPCCLLSINATRRRCATQLLQTTIMSVCTHWSACVLQVLHLHALFCTLCVLYSSPPHIILSISLSQSCRYYPNCLPVRTA